MKTTFFKGQHKFVLEGTPEEMSKFMSELEGTDTPRLFTTKESQRLNVKRGRLPVSDGYPSAEEFEAKMINNKGLQNKPFKEVMSMLNLSIPKGIGLSRVRMRFIRAKRKLQV